MGTNIFFTQYTPSLIEILVGFGVVSFGIFAVLLGIEFLGIVDHGVTVKRTIEDKNRTYQWPVEGVENKA